MFRRRQDEREKQKKLLWSCSSVQNGCCRRVKWRTNSWVSWFGTFSKKPKWNTLHIILPHSKCFKLFSWLSFVTNINMLTKLIETGHETPKSITVRRPWLELNEVTPDRYCKSRPENVSTRSRADRTALHSSSNSWNTLLLRISSAHILLLPIIKNVTFSTSVAYLEQTCVRCSTPPWIFHCLSLVSSRQAPASEDTLPCAIDLSPPHFSSG